MPIPVRPVRTAGTFEIATESGFVPVDIRRHPRARNYTLRVAGPGKPPILTMPQRGSLAEAHRFLERHAGWLRRQIDRLPPAIPIADGWPVPLRGVLHTIHHDPARRGTVTVGADENGPALYVSGAPAHLRRRVIDFLKREARRDIEAAVARHAARLGVTPKAIRTRDQITRWGSCTTNGHLSFSWRLIMAPPLRARLSRRPRGGASRRDEPLAPLLDAVQVAVARDRGGPRLAFRPGPGAPRHRRRRGRAAQGGVRQADCVGHPPFVMGEFEIAITRG